MAAERAARRLPEDDPSQTAVQIVHGDLLTGIHDRTPPTTTYWATLRTGEYDSLTPP